MNVNEDGGLSHMESFEMMKELQFKKNILGSLLTICGAYFLIITMALNFYMVPSFSVTLVVISVLTVGVIMMIAGLFFMETLIRGSALVFSGVQLILYEIVFQLLKGSFTPRLLLIVGVPILIVGIILVIIGFCE